MDVRILHLEQLSRKVKELSNSYKNFSLVLELYNTERKSEDIVLGSIRYHKNLFYTGWKVKAPLEDLLAGDVTQHVIDKAYQSFIEEFLCDINGAILICKIRPCSEIKQKEPGFTFDKEYILSKETVSSN